MRIIAGLRGLEALKTELRVTRSTTGSSAGSSDLEAHSAVTVGVFDGMHLGHGRLLHELLELASAENGVPTVITFTNHPEEVLTGHTPQPIISVPHRLRLLRRSGVQRLLLLTFDESLRQMDAAQFARQILVQGLGARALLLGYDSALGRDREGTAQRFSELGRELGFRVVAGQPFTLDGEPVSSSAIRAAISSGDLDLCLRLLGRRVSAFGTVIPGTKRGRILGFPTANMQPQSQALPPHGVYAVEVLHAGEQYEGVANLGTRPTFAGSDPGEEGEGEGPQPLLEVHLLDQEETGLELYGVTLEVGFIARLRPEQRFASGEELGVQIQADIVAARKLFVP